MGLKNLFAKRDVMNSGPGICDYMHAHTHNTTAPYTVPRYDFITLQ